MTIFLVHSDNSKEEISHDRAIHLLDGNYNENICTYDELLESVVGYGCVLRVGGGACLEVTE